MSRSEPSSTSHEKKLPGWAAPLVVILAIGGLGWFAWRQVAGEPSAGERIELAPLPEARAGNRGLGDAAVRALSNLGRNRRAASQPATRPAQR